MSDDDIYVRYCDVCAKANAATERLEIVEAERVALMRSLSELVAYVRAVGGFMRHEDQETLRRAMAVLEEALSR